MNFITLEGIDRCGKTTVINRLKQDFPDYLFVQDPSPDIREGFYRDVLLNKKLDERTRFLLYLTARSELIEQKIKPALKEGKTVICDRFYDSTTVYQFGYSMMTAYFENPGEINQFAAHDLVPTKTILIDVPAHISYQRGEPSDEYELSINMNLDTIRKLYLQLAEQEARRIHVVDGTKSKNEVYAKILKIINKEKEPRRA